MQAKNKKLNSMVLFDSSAMIALLKKEHGFELLDDVLAHSSISTVNLSEIVSVLARSGVVIEEIDKIIYGLVPQIIPFSQEIAILAGKMIIHTQNLVCHLAIEHA
jgi:PIN domain nuclease of toxin-antitoxin system